MSFNVPILLITWRRPETTRKVIESIREFSPQKIYIHSDGPRKNSNDLKSILETRNLLDKEINWTDNIKKFYRKENRGLYLGGSGAINWFFENEEEGIILEDDTVPNNSFLTYCEEMLSRYRYDNRIWCISGSNFQKGNWRGDASYYFSKHIGVWGWATWRRCWINFDPELKMWPKFKKSQSLKSIFEDKVERKYWSNIWQKTFDNPYKVNTWDYQWVFTCLTNNGLTVVPNINLVKNIGFGKDATHTKVETHSTKNDKSLGPLVHPEFIIRDARADRFEFDYLHGGKEKRSLFFFFLNLPKRIYRAVTKRIINLRSS